MKTLKCFFKTSVPARFLFNFNRPFRGWPFLNDFSHYVWSGNINSSPRLRSGQSAVWKSITADLKLPGWSYNQPWGGRKRVSWVDLRAGDESEQSAAAKAPACGHFSFLSPYPRAHCGAAGEKSLNHWAVEKSRQFPLQLFCIVP